MFGTSILPPPDSACRPMVAWNIGVSQDNEKVENSPRLRGKSVSGIGRIGRGERKIPKVHRKTDSTRIRIAVKMPRLEMKRLREFFPCRAVLVDRCHRRNPPLCYSNAHQTQARSRMLESIHGRSSRWAMANKQCCFCMVCLARRFIGNV